MSDFASVVIAAAIWLAAGAAMFAVGYILTWRELSRGNREKPAATPLAEPSGHDVTFEWLSGNHWFLLDPALRMEAEILHTLRRQEKPLEPLAENLAAVTEEMRKRHPEIRPN